MTDLTLPTQHRMLSDDELRLEPDSASTYPEWTLSANQFIRLLPSPVHILPQRVITVQLISAAPTWKEPVQEAFMRLVELRPGWDSTKAAEVSRVAIRRAIEVLDQFMTTETVVPNILPLPDGGVSLEWYVNGWEVQFEVSSDARVFVSAERIDGNGGFEGELAERVQNTLQLMRELGRRQ